ncbi:MAG TPA: protein translocase subunit SecF [Candidatus Krumholzibacteria bacterium]|nr:protein translocase subunit SecF [Candidatus Krumholzibacteria bacterium]
MEFFRTPDINFVGVARKALVVSGAVLIAGFISMGVQRGLKQSIDFAGGALVEVRTETAVPLQDIRSIVAAAGFENAEITRFGADNEFLIKVKSIEEADATAKAIVAAIQNGIGQQQVDLRRVETVGPKIGAELRSSGVQAVIWSMIGILIYVGWRFDFRFAVASILATLHDVLLTLTFFSFTGIEMSLGVLAAVLTIVGYSLNDTVVVFDRIRENLGLKRGVEFGKLVNTSINETLSRTVITGTTTLLVLVSLIFLGGEVIRDFAITLFVGIIIGTYSSVFVAAPIVLEWHRWRPLKSR